MEGFTRQSKTLFSTPEQRKNWRQVEQATEQTITCSPT